MGLGNKVDYEKIDKAAKTVDSIRDKSAAVGEKGALSEGDVPKPKAKKKKKPISSIQDLRDTYKAKFEGPGDEVASEANTSWKQNDDLDQV